MGRGGTGWKKMKVLTKEHIFITHRHRPQCGDGQRGGWEAKVGQEMGKQGEKGDICNSVNNKNELKIKYLEKIFE